MPTTHATDLDLTPRQIAGLVSPDAIAAFFAELGYDTSRRNSFTPEAIGLTGDSATAVKQIEVLCEDADGFLRVVFVQLRSLTAKCRNDLARVLGKANVDHLLVLTSDFSTLEFVLLDKRRREVHGPARGTAIQVVPLTFAVERKSPATKELRALRRFTWNKRDGLEQFDKLRNVFSAAAFTEEYFCNRALFADHYLMTRLREDPAWQENPSQAFHAVRDLCRDANVRWKEKGEQAARHELYEPLFDLLGISATVNKQPGDGHAKPDYLLAPKSGGGNTAAFVYTWDRWLDGPDYNLDQETPDENPGACVVSALEEGVADWIIVTNGRQWRLYSKIAHSRATNFYEVDLIEAIVASGDTDPNEAFRYWWLFFRAEAFAPRADSQVGCWLDTIAEGSRDYAKALGERLKDRVFVTIFPYLAQGFLADRRQRLGIKKQATADELRDVYEATLTLLYRLLFLLYAEARDLLPIREAPYREKSLRKIKDEIDDKAGIAESEVSERINKAYAANEHALYDRLMRLCAAMDKGDPALNVPIYNGGLFITQPGDNEDREQRIARFLAEHKVPDRFLALAIDRLARDPDDKTFSLVAIDYKSLEVRHLGSIYEGLLEFKLKVAEEDLTTHTEKKREKYIPLGKAKAKRGKAPSAVVRKGEVYLSNDKAERKASGSYYTPDPIVEYIVEHTVGPVLEEKLEKLRPEFRKVRKTFDNELAKLRVPPVPQEVRNGDLTDREFAGEKTYKTHQPLVEELFDFRVLDPAMGSGHFLVEAVDRVTDRLLAFLNQFPINPVTFMLDRMRKNILEALGEQGVSVDPDKLTEVNLLKRHVLKRCIYGVDLNPMAVELAKVSLWLDAFTIGAPLSFLDHHLRCGNSLIGATFKDLEVATKGQLFGIDYEPLLRAIRHVLHVNAMADATAAEVKQSATEYGQARDQLAGYQIVLDLLVAQHFGVPDAPELLSRGGSELRLSSRSDFMQMLADLNELAVVEKVEQVATLPQLRFFHWEIEFPEVFFGFADVDQRHLRHRNEIAEGSAGFNAVVGNPPYVRQETIKLFKNYLKSQYGTFDSANDLYVYFQEREIGLLASDCRMGMIVSNKWMRAGYGERIRDFLKLVARPIDLIDFGHTPIFPDADTFPCVLVTSRRDRPVASIVETETYWACPVPRADWHEQLDLGDYSRRKGYWLATNLMRPEAWSLEDPRLQTLMTRIKELGRPLSSVIGAEPQRGLLTGLNDAFAVDATTYESLVAKDANARKVLRPLLRGRDMDRWHPRISTLHLIVIASSENQEWPWSTNRTDAERTFRRTFPSIYDHLAQHKPALERRQDQGRFWWELRSCDYMDAFDQPKLVWQEMAWFTRFAVDEESHVLNNTGYILATTNPVIMSCLNSPLAWWYMWRTAQHGKDEVLRLIKSYMVDFPIPAPSAVDEEITSAVTQLRKHMGEFHEWENECVQGFRGFGIADGDDRVLTWLPASEEIFLRRCTELNGIDMASAASTGQFTTFKQTHRTKQVGFLIEQRRLEQYLSDLVFQAYGIDEEEKSLIRGTRPPRDPLDVLTARIEGQLIEDKVSG